MKHKLEAVGATLASVSGWIVDAHQTIQLAISALTLAWWLRLWITNKKDPKP